MLSPQNLSIHEMQTLKKLSIIGLLILGIFDSIQAADDLDTPITLEAARVQGRAESRFLKESRPSGDRHRRCSNRECRSLSRVD